MDDETPQIEPVIPPVEAAVPAGMADVAHAVAVEGSSAAPHAGDIPYWHTALLLLVLAVLSLGNAHSGHGAKSGQGHVRIYLATMIYEWLLTLFVWWGVRRSGGSLRELIGGRWQRVEDFLLDIAIGCGTWIGALLVLARIGRALGMGQANGIQDAQNQLGFLAPRTGLDIVLWLGLSATAGFCEEVLFRGYLQRQLTRLVRNRWLALAVVSVFFGLGHGYEGASRMVLIGALGFCFGVVSLLRRSLRPAMMAHTMQDAVSGLLLRSLR